MRFWSITTTIRNPERLPAAIPIITEFNGFSYKKNDPNQKRDFQSLVFIKSFQTKWYGFESPQFKNNLSKEHLKWMSNAQDKNEDLIFEKAKIILETKRYEGGLDLRGRQLINLFKKLFLCWIDTWSSKTHDIFRVHPNAVNLVSNVSLFYRHALLLSYQYPDLSNKIYKKEDGYNIKPLVATLVLIRSLNYILQRSNKKVNGITMNEFQIFCITMINGDQIRNRVKKILSFREDFKNIIKKDQNKFLRKRFLQENGEGYKFENANEYGDNVFRYFKLTDFFVEKRYGNNWYINLNPVYIDEIDKVISFYGVYAKMIDDPQDQVSFFTDAENSIILDKKIVKEELLSIFKKYPSLRDEKINKLSLVELLNYKENVLFKIKEMNINKIRDGLMNNKMDSLSNIINILKGDYNNFTPEGLEYQTASAFMCLADPSSLIKPNYSADTDGYPKSHAKANFPDIECFLNEYNLICEVTKLTGRNQWYQESVPIQRHLHEFESKNNNKESYCLFIAARFHDDALWSIWCSVKHGYLDGNKQKIIPLTIYDFSEILIYFSSIEDFEVNFRNFLNRCLNLQDIDNFKNWRKNIETILKDYKNE